MNINHIEYKEYELFVKNLHEKILEKDGFEDIEIQHNIKLEGKSGATHQIDVFWNQKIDNKDVKICIECKNWKSTVTQGDILKFKGVLDDIGNAKGIFVTKRGFQSGACKVAKYYGISLIRANSIDNEYTSRMEMHFISFSNFEFQFDKERSLEEQNKIIDKLYNCKQEDLSQIEVYSSNGELKSKLQYIVDDVIEYIEEKYSDVVPESWVFSSSPRDSYVKIDNELIKIELVECNYDKIHNKDLDLYSIYKVTEFIADYIFENRQELFTIEKT